MNSVPQQYYDICARVEQYLQQSLQKQGQTPQRSTLASTLPTTQRRFQVHTLPDSPPNVDFVRAHFPMHSPAPSSPNTTVNRNVSIPEEAKCATRDAIDLERRYAQLLQRIVNDSPSAE